MAKKVIACRIRFLSAPQASGSRPQHVVTRYGMAPAAQPGARLRPEHARQKLRLWGHPVRMSCKNFLTTHQLDTHFWTEFLYTFSWQYDPSRRVCRKRADTVGQPPSKF
jgi:hypothetical protein